MKSVVWFLVLPVAILAGSLPAPAALAQVGTRVKQTPPSGTAGGTSNVFTDNISGGVTDDGAALNDGSSSTYWSTGGSGSSRIMAATLPDLTGLGTIQWVSVRIKAYVTATAVDTIDIKLCNDANNDGDVADAGEVADGTDAIGTNVSTGTFFPATSETEYWENFYAAPGGTWNQASWQIRVVQADGPDGGTTVDNVLRITEAWIVFRHGAPGSNPETLYVDFTSGSDSPSATSGQGSSSYPLLTLKEATVDVPSGGSISNGWTILVQGTGSSTVECPIKNKITTATYPLVIKAASPFRPLAPTSDNVFLIQSTNYVTISGFEIKPANNKWGVYIFRSCNNINIENNIIHPASAATLNDGVFGIIIYNTGTGFTVDSVKITGNVIYECGGDGTNGGSAISLDSANTPTITNVTIQNNILFNNEREAIEIESNANVNSGINIYNNTFYNNATNTSTPDALPLVNADVAVGANVDSGAVQLKNNIFFTTDSAHSYIYVAEKADISGANTSGNHYYNSSGSGTSHRWYVLDNSAPCNDAVTVLTDWQGSSCGINGDSGATTGNPQFVSTTSGSEDFHLLSRYGYPTGVAKTVGVLINTTPTTWARSATTDSPAIDGGGTTLTLADTVGSRTYTTELEDNGNATDRGAYGNTKSASKSGSLASNYWTGNGATALSNTITMTNGSTTVTGSGFSSEVAAGDKIRLDREGTWYTVSSVTNDTTLVLTSAFSGTTSTGAGSLLDSAWGNHGNWAHGIPGDISSNPPTSATLDLWGNVYIDASDAGAALVPDPSATNTSPTVKAAAYAGNVTLRTGTLVLNASQTLDVRGSWLKYPTTPTLTANSGSKVKFTAQSADSDPTLDPGGSSTSDDFADLEIAMNSARTLTFNSDTNTTVVAQGTLTVTSGTLRVAATSSAGRTLDLQGTSLSHTVASGATLNLRSTDNGSGTARDASLLLGNGSSLAVSGTLRSNRLNPYDVGTAKINASAGGSNTYGLSVTSTGTLTLEDFSISNLDGSGLVINNGATVNAVNYGTFTTSATNTLFLDLSAVTFSNRSKLPWSLLGLTFTASAGDNIKTGLDTPIVYVSGSGTRFGESYDNDPSEMIARSDGRVRWVSNVVDIVGGSSYSSLRAAVQAAGADTARLRVSVNFPLNEAIDFDTATTSNRAPIFENAVLAPMSGYGSYALNNSDATDRGILRNGLILKGGVKDLKKVDNCTVFDPFSATAIEIRHCASVRNGLLESGTVTTDSTVDASTETLSAANSVDDSSNPVFFHPEALDFHLKAGRAGTNIGPGSGASDAWAVADDFEGHTRTNWDKGFDEYIASAGGVDSTPSGVSSTILGEIADFRFVFRTDAGTDKDQIYAVTRKGSSSRNNMLVVLDRVPSSGILTQRATFDAGATNSIVSLSHFVIKTGSNPEVRLFLVLDVNDDGDGDGVMAVIDTGGTGTFTASSPPIDTTGDVQSDANAANWYYANSIYLDKSFDSDGTADGINNWDLGSTIAGKISNLLVVRVSGGSSSGGTTTSDLRRQDLAVFTVSDATLYKINADPLDTTNYGKKVWGSGAATFEWRAPLWTLPRFTDRQIWVAISNNSNSDNAMCATLPWGSSTPSITARWKVNSGDGTATDEDSAPYGFLMKFQGIGTGEQTFVYLAPNEATSNAYVKAVRTGDTIDGTTAPYWKTSNLGDTTRYNRSRPTRPLPLSAKVLFVAVGDRVHKIKDDPGWGGTTAPTNGSGGQMWDSTDTDGPFPTDSTMRTRAGNISTRLEYSRVSSDTTYIAWGTENGYIFIMKVRTDADTTAGNESLASGFPYVVPGDRIVDVRTSFDSLTTWSFIFSTAGGRVLKFKVP
jgi:hypothetical protein